MNISFDSLKIKFQEYGLTWKLIVFIISLMGLPFVIYGSLQLHAEDESLRLAKSFSTVITTVRSYYANNVAKNILDSHGKIVLTENYKNINGGVPIPATLSIELGEILKEKSSEDGFMFSFVSDMPFLRRDRRPLDEFQELALKSFRTESSSNEYWKVEDIDLFSSIVRYAVPVRMENSCVACHNSHPDSPMRSWKVGDVRGIQDVQVNLSLEGQAESSLFLGAYLLFFIGAGALALREALDTNNSLKKLYIEKNDSESELKFKKIELERNISELSTKTAVIEKAPFGIAIANIKNSELLIDYANENFLRKAGYSSEQLKQKTYRLLLGIETNIDDINKLTVAISKRENIELELILYRSDGSSFWARCLFFPTYNHVNEFQHFIICQSDITDLKNSEIEKNKLAGELQESLKLESLGLTIAGIAHDLNTPIGVSITAITHLENCLKKISTNPDNFENIKLISDLNEIDETANLIKSNLSKAANLVKSFKQTSIDASRQEWQTINARTFLETLLTALSPVTKRAKVEVNIDCSESLIFHTEPGSLSQVITNLVINSATHAFNEAQDVKKITVSMEDLGKILSITVTDNGSGMTDDVLAKLFMPFFTTKKNSGGTGLGLFSAKRIIEQIFKGNLICKSNYGFGTSFIISIPVDGVLHE